MGRKFNAAYHVTKILSPSFKRRSAGAKGDKRKLIICADNSRPRTAQQSTGFFRQNRMKTAPHPPYSPNLAPPDFYLFGYLKGCLVGFSSESANELLEAVRGLLAGLEKGTMQPVFLERMN
jgi:hypothetical protein